MVHVFARAKSKPGAAHELRNIPKELMQSSRAEDGVLTYELFEIGATGEFIFREEYATQEAFEKHKSSYHVRVAVARAVPFMDGNLSLWIVEPVSEC